MSKEKTLQVQQVTVEFTIPDQFGFNGTSGLSITYYPDKPPASKLYSSDRHEYTLEQLEKLGHFFDAVSRTGARIKGCIDELTNYQD
ncbi:hypothetical protein LCGC14_0976630 [marine sediment metagenome]|uniref:Uncharacterized protein n=1 Tax=marine sediment metagenome TaxID=412755 RepID=A0A0F9RGK1_9ZZZZ